MTRLYHWSPRERRESIEKYGLIPNQKSIIAAYAVFREDHEEYRQASISFSLTPAQAWRYSHGTWRTEGTFDLWEISLEDDDDLRVHTYDANNEIVEVRIYGRIHKSRLVWVGERTTKDTND